MDKTCQTCGITYLGRSKQKYCSLKCRPGHQNGGPKPSPPELRFWKHVSPGADDECWEWQGATMLGYGYLQGDETRRWIKAHRLSWEIHRGPIPDGKYVLHHCDNPPCVNPAHLYIGWHTENARDRAERRRGREHRAENHGELAPGAKLTEDQARGVLAALAELPQRSQSEIAAEFGISQPQVSRIMRAQSWAHLN